MNNIEFGFTYKLWYCIECQALSQGVILLESGNKIEKSLIVVKFSLDTIKKPSY